MKKYLVVINETGRFLKIDDSFVHLSPDATWLNDGDEVNEEDVAISQHFFQTRSGNIYTDYPWTEEFKRVTGARVKCSNCKYFH